jgi:hypothetical protein
MGLKSRLNRVNWRTTLQDAVLCIVKHTVVLIPARHVTQHGKDRPRSVWDLALRLELETVGFLSGKERLDSIVLYNSVKPAFNSVSWH